MRGKNEVVVIIYLFYTMPRSTGSRPGSLSARPPTDTEQMCFALLAIFSIF